MGATLSLHSRFIGLNLHRYELSHSSSRLVPCQHEFPKRDVPTVREEWKDENPDTGTSYRRTDAPIVSRCPYTMTRSQLVDLLGVWNGVTPPYEDGHVCCCACAFLNGDLSILSSCQYSTPTFCEVVGAAKHLVHLGGRVVIAREHGGECPNDPPLPLTCLPSQAVHGYCKLVSEPRFFSVFGNYLFSVS